MKKLILITALFIAATSAFAQKEAYNWLLGGGGRLTWNGVGETNGKLNLPQPDLGGNAMTTQQEGIFNISDANGNLLFYSDGNTVWNRNHAIMPNGTGLGGNNSSAQSGIIIGYPGQPGKYIAVSIEEFQNGAGTPTTLYYAVIDMTLQGGLGDVTTKHNSFLGGSGNLQESVSAIKISGEKGYWIVAKGYGSPWSSAATTPSYLNVWKITATSGIQVNRHSVITLPATSGAYGYLRFSSNKRYFALTANNRIPDNFLLVGEFNAATASFSNIKRLTLPTAGGSAYGVEFSPSGQVLYASNCDGADRNIYVYNVASVLANASPTPAITPKTVTPAGYPAGNSGIGALQLGPDGRIYGAVRKTSSLIVIDNVEDYANFTYQITGGLMDVSVSGGMGVDYGLPNFPATMFERQAHIQDEFMCAGDTKTLSFNLATRALTNTPYWYDDAAKVAIDLDGDNPKYAIDFGRTHVHQKTSNICDTFYIRVQNASQTDWVNDDLVDTVKVWLSPDTLIWTGNDGNINFFNAQNWTVPAKPQYAAYPEITEDLLRYSLSCCTIPRYWWYLSSFQDGATARSFVLDTTLNKIGFHTESTGDYDIPPLMNNAPSYMLGDAVNQGRGFAALLYATPPQEHYLNGFTLISGDVNVPVSRTSSRGSQAGFNLLGNPYSVAVKAADFLAANRANLWEHIWYRAHYQNDYKTLVWDYLEHDANAGSTVSISNSGKSEASLDTIGVMQGFWVRLRPEKVGQPNLRATFTEAMKVSDYSHGSLRVGSSNVAADFNETTKIRLKVTSARNYSDQLLLNFRTGGSLGIDAGDVEKLQNDISYLPEIYTRASMQELAINCLPPAAAGMEIAVGFRTGEAGNFTLAATELANIPENLKAVLLDSQTGAATDLSAGNAYAFTAQAGDNAARFTLKTVSKETDVNSVQNSKFKVQSLNGKITVQGDKIQDEKAEVFNAIGQKLHEETINSTFHILHFTFPSGVYFVKINNETFKVIIK